MTTTYYIHTTNKHQHKLRNSKNSAQHARYFPKIPRTPEPAKYVNHPLPASQP
jgi:hypothetical protein